MCMSGYVCVHVVRGRGTTSACTCGEVWDLVMA